MRTVLQTIRILVLTLLFKSTCCQDGFNNQDIPHAQKGGNDGHIETMTGYTNNAHDPNSQSIASLSVQYQMPDDANKFDFNRERARTRKVYRIKNPFSSQQGDETQLDTNNPQDSSASASNQYAGMQYSLPPEDFLQQMRAENQYHQQQQQQQQLSTQASAYSYTATPQPQYSYSTLSVSNYDNQPAQTGQEPQSFNSIYNSNANTFQYNNANNYNLDTSYSTPSPSFLSTPSNQYSIGTPTNTYVSSASPMYITNPPNLQPYVSSPYANTQTGTADYNSNRVSTIGNSLQNYDNSMLNKKAPTDQYGNSLRYPTNMQNQYQHDFSSSTMSPVSSSYSEEMRDNWQNSGANFNNGLALPKSSQDLSLAQHPINTHYRYNTNNNQEDIKPDNNHDNINQDSHRFSGLSSANNIYYNYLNLDNQQNNYKGQVREIDQQVGQTAVYSHGDYGWKLNEKKPLYGGDLSTGSYLSYQLHNAKSDNGAVSQVSFHMDTSRPYNYNTISKSSSEKLEAEEFARAAAKAHENLKQQLEANRFSTNNQYSNNAYLNGDSYYSNNDKSKNKYENQNSNQYSSGSVRTDYVTASPYFARESFLDNKPKQPFDHDNAIKNIVPIDVSNVVQNSNAQMKSNNGFDLNDKYNSASSNKEQIEQNFKQFHRPTSETYYKDKNNIYSFGIKSQPEDYMTISERLKQKDSTSYQGKSQPSESYFGFGGFSGNKRYGDDSSPLNNYGSHSSGNQDSASSPDNIQQHILDHKPISSDMASILKFNDIPLRLTHNLNTDSFRLQNNNFDQSGIPNPLPIRLSQNLENHHVDVATDILNKLIASKQNNINSNRQESESQNLLSTINGFKVANPFNIDLKLVAEMLKGKPVIDDSQMSSLRDPFTKPIKFDIPQIQQLLLKNDNTGTGLTSSLGTIPSAYFEILSNSRYPYQGIKYSRSEEEPENIPIAESNSHPIGAVVEEDASVVGQDNSDVTATEEDSESNIDEERPLKLYSTNHRAMGDRYRHSNSLSHVRQSYQKKYPKTPVDQPYPLLKPPPAHRSRSKIIQHSDKSNRKRRVNKPKTLRFFKTEPLFEANASDLDETKMTVSTLLQPPPVIEDRSDVEEDTLEES